MIKFNRGVTCIQFLSGVEDTDDSKLFYWIQNKCTHTHTHTHTKPKQCKVKQGLCEAPIFSTSCPYLPILHDVRSFKRHQSQYSIVWYNSALITALELRSLCINHPIISRSRAEAAVQWSFGRRVYLFCAAKAGLKPQCIVHVQNRHE